MSLGPWDWNPSWNVTWAELYFLMGGEIELERAVWEYDQTPPDERAIWPDEGEVMGWRICLWEIDQHVAANTLPDFRAEIQSRFGGVFAEDEAMRQWKVEKPWIDRYVNMIRVLDGKDCDAKRKAENLVIRQLGYQRGKNGEGTTITNFAVHPRLEMETLATIEQFRPPANRPKQPVPWGTPKRQRETNEMRNLILGSGSSQTKAAAKVAAEAGEDGGDHRPKDLTKLFRAKMKLRSGAAKVISGE